MNLSGPVTGLEMMMPYGRKAPVTNSFTRRAYYVNKMVIGLTGEQLLAELDRRMDESMKTPGSQEFAAAFDSVSKAARPGVEPYPCGPVRCSVGFARGVPTHDKHAGKTRHPASARQGLSFWKRSARARITAASRLSTRRRARGSAQASRTPSSRSRCKRQRTGWQNSRSSSQPAFLTAVAIYASSLSRAG